jgi:hypothetical protein
MAFDDTTVIAIIAVVVIIAVAASATIILTMRRRLQPQAKPAKSTRPDIDPYLNPAPSPFRVSKSVGATDATQAKNELRILELEREIVGDAIRRLYEAHAEGKISEQERERLAASYKNRMMQVKESMAKDETTVALYELESMEEDLMKLFRERLGEIDSKVEELRGRIDLKPIREIKIQMPKPQAPVMPDMEKDEGEEEEEPEAVEAEAKEKPQQQRKRKPPEERQTNKTEAELRIESMRNKIDEITKKLGQMEIES